MANHDTDPMRQLRNRIMQTTPLKIVVGSGSQMYPPDWICTNVEELDVTDLSDWKFLFNDFNENHQRIDTVFAEHVWEHLTEEQALAGAKNVFSFLKPGGVFRIAVPDGYFPSEEYVEKVRPGGTGAGADDHKILWNFHTLSHLLRKCGFDIDIVEYWDEKQTFRFHKWTEENGKVLRSMYNDERNYNDGDNRVIRYTSLMIDAIKPVAANKSEEGVVKIIRKRERGGKDYFNLDDFIGTITTAIQLNSAELEDALRELKLFYIKVSAALEEKSFESVGEYAGEKLLSLDDTISDIANSIAEAGEYSLQGTAHKITLDILVQLKNDTNTFGEN